MLCEIEIEKRVQWGKKSGAVFVNASVPPLPDLSIKFCVIDRIEWKHCVCLMKNFDREYTCSSFLRCVVPCEK